MVKIIDTMIVIRRINMPHRTRCGYPVKDLIANVDSRMCVTYSGYFKGVEDVWLPRKWDAEGLELGCEENTNMALEYVGEEK